MKWATVTQVDPLRIRLDGPDTTALPLTPESLIDPAMLAVGDRVRVEWAGRRLVIHGRAGGLGVEVAFTPNFTTGITIGNGTLVGGYARVGALVVVKYYLLFGSSTEVTANVNVETPFDIGGATGAAISLSGVCRDVSTATRYPVLGYRSSTAGIALRVLDSTDTYAPGASFGASVPFAWDAGDELTFVASWLIP